MDAFDTWSLRKVFRIPYTRRVLNATVRESKLTTSISYSRESSPFSLARDTSRLEQLESVRAACETKQI